MKIINKTPTNPWEKGEMLWKPVAEHVKKPCVVTLPRKKVKAVQILDHEKRKIKTLRFRSTGDAGDAWQDYHEAANKYPKSIYIRVMRSETLAWDYEIKDTRKRSDGKPGEGNYK